MTWTTEYPTKPGYYWLKRQSPDENPLVVIFLSSPDDQGKADPEFYFIGNEMASGPDEASQAEWYGPIEPPE